MVAEGRQVFFSGKAKQNKVGAKEGLIFFSGKAKQNKVGAKERQIFFSGRAKQNEVGSKERNSVLLLQCWRKSETTESLFSSNFILFRSTAKRDLSLFCSNPFYVSLFYENSISFRFVPNASNLNDIGLCEI